MKKVVGFQMTERDMEIIKFINNFGFCEISQINKKFNLKKPRNYQILNRLIEAKFLKHERVFFGRPGIYRTTAKGAELTDFPALEKIPLTNYAHNMLIADLYLKLMEKYPEATWISERQLKFDKCFDGIGKYGHTADGILFFPDGKEIHIEVELTMKGQRRLEKILKSYYCQFQIEEVWYFCSQNILKKLVPYQQDFRMLKVFNVHEFLAV